MAKRGSFDRSFFASLGKNVEAAAKLALEEGAKDIVIDMKSRIHNVSGDLAESAHYEKLNSARKIKIVADAKDEKGVAYGQYVEFGTNQNPFMYPAFDAQRDNIKKRIVDVIRKECAKNAIKR